jgi:hypothetical protein
MSAAELTKNGMMAHLIVSKRMRFWTVVLFCIAVPSEIPGYLFGGLH